MFDVAESTADWMVVVTIRGAIIMSRGVRCYEVIKVNAQDNIISVEILNEGGRSRKSLMKQKLWKALLGSVYDKLSILSRRAFLIGN